VAAGVIIGEMGTETFFGHANYFDLGGNITLIFCALAGSELIIPDRTRGTISVYASRPLTASDYVSARAVSMASVVFGFVWLPHLILLIGRAWTSPDGFADYFVGHLDLLWQTAAASAVYIVAYGSLAFLVAVFSTRAALAVFAFLVAVFAWSATTQALVNAGYEIIGITDLVGHPGYVKDWIMGESTGEWVPEAAGFEPFVSLIAIGVVVAITGLAVLRRYRRVL
jgi:ABC-2 type transport system permease protein